MKRISVVHPSDLGQILDFIHDRSYDLSSIVFDEKSHELTVTIKLDGKGLVGHLVVHDALSYQLRDEAEIGEGDINIIEVISDAVVIQGAIPVDITVKVSDFRLTLTLPDNAGPA